MELSHGENRTKLKLSSVFKMWIHLNCICYTRSSFRSIDHPCLFEVLMKNIKQMSIDHLGLEIPSVKNCPIFCWRGFLMCFKSKIINNLGDPFAKVNECVKLICFKL